MVLRGYVILLVIFSLSLTAQNSKIPKIIQIRQAGGSTQDQEKFPGANILFKTDTGLNGESTEKIVINSLELRMPYVKLENQKNVALWERLYNKPVNRYWLDVDQFWSSPIANNVGQSNSTFRVATKGLNSKPRWLLLHTVNDNGTNVEKHKPMGFGNDKAAEYNDIFNTIRFKKLRVKINGIYIV